MKRKRYSLVLYYKVNRDDEPIDFDTFGFYEWLIFRSNVSAISYAVRHDILDFRLRHERV